MTQDTYRQELVVYNLFAESDPEVRRVLGQIPANFTAYHPTRDDTHLDETYRLECDALVATGDDSALRERWDDYHFDIRAEAVDQALDDACAAVGISREDLTEEQVETIRESIFDRDTDSTLDVMMRESTGTFVKSVGHLDMTHGAHAALEAKARELGANVNHPDVRTALRHYVNDHSHSWGPQSTVTVQFAGNLADVGDAVSTGESRQFDASISVDDEAPVRLGTVQTTLAPGEVRVQAGRSSWGHDARSRPRTYGPMRDQYGFESGLVVGYDTNTVFYADGRTLTTEGNKGIETSGIRTTTVTHHGDGTQERHAVTKASNFELEQHMRTGLDGTFERSMFERSPEGTIRKYMREQLDSEGVLTQERGDGLNTSSLTKWPDGSSELVESGPNRRREVLRDDTTYRETVEDIGRKTTSTRSVDVTGNSITVVNDGLRGTSRASFVRGRHSMSGTIVRPDGTNTIVESHTYEPGHHIDAALELLKD